MMFRKYVTVTFLNQRKSVKGLHKRMSRTRGSLAYERNTFPTGVVTFKLECVSLLFIYSYPIDYVSENLRR